MVSKEEIKKLADLARIDLPDAEIAELVGEIDAILDYVGQISMIPYPEQGKGTLKRNEEGHALAGGGVINVMREDQTPTASETHSKELIAEFPKGQNNYLKVKKIL